MAYPQSVTLQSLLYTAFWLILWGLYSILCLHAPPFGYTMENGQHFIPIPKPKSNADQPEHTPDVFLCTNGTFTHRVWDCLEVKRFGETVSTVLSTLLRRLNLVSQDILPLNDTWALELNIQGRHFFAGLPAAKRMVKKNQTLPWDL